MDAVVDVGAPVHQRAPRLKGLGKGLAGQLGREIEIGGDAAGGGRCGSAGEVVSGPGRSGIEQQVRVWIDDAGQHQEAFRIDHRVFGREPRPDVDDRSVTNQHVGVLLAAGGDHAPAADQHGRDPVIRSNIYAPIS